MTLKREETALVKQIKDAAAKNNVAGAVARMGWPALGSPCLPAFQPALPGSACAEQQRSSGCTHVQGADKE